MMAFQLAAADQLESLYPLLAAQIKQNAYLVQQAMIQHPIGRAAVQPAQLGG